MCVFLISYPFSSRVKLLFLTFFFPLSQHAYSNSLALTLSLSLSLSLSLYIYIYIYIYIYNHFITTHVFALGVYLLSSLSLFMYFSLYTSFSLSISFLLISLSLSHSLSLYVYIYREREKEREREKLENKIIQRDKLNLLSFLQRFRRWWEMSVFFSWSEYIQLEWEIHENWIRKKYCLKDAKKPGERDWKRTNIYIYIYIYIYIVIHRQTARLYHKSSVSLDT